jgi:hypothetical protein
MNHWKRARANTLITNPSPNIKPYFIHSCPFVGILNVVGRHVEVLNTFLTFKNFLSNEKQKLFKSKNV